MVTGVSAHFPQNVSPEFLTKNVNLHLHSEATNTSDEDSAEDDARGELPRDEEVRF